MRVSVIVPCRNEAGRIDAFLDAALAQDLPQGVQLQIVVADGDDGTRQRLAERAVAEPRVRLVDNPQRSTSAALNRAIAALGEAGRAAVTSTSTGQWPKRHC